jgi:outer membrane protein OmpA-like peptidoglycan-associated protein
MGRTARIAAAAMLVLELLLGGPAQARQYFVIIFGTDQSSLTHEARQIVDLIAQRAHERHLDGVAVAGYGDGIGDPAKDAALADQRAATIIKALEAAGIKPSLIKKTPALPLEQATGIPVHKVTVTLLP